MDCAIPSNNDQMNPPKTSKATRLAGEETVDEEAELHSGDDADPPMNWISYETAKRLEDKAEGLLALVSCVDFVIGHWRQTDWFESRDIARHEIVVWVDQQSARDLLKKLETALRL